jgi:hypothetical protein
MLNASRVKNQVMRLISRMPTDVELRRKQFIEDGIGGLKEVGEIIVGNYQGFFQTESSNLSSILSLTEKTSKIVSKKYSIIFVDVPCNEGDYFMAKGKTFRILDPSDNGIYQECELEVI